MITIALKFVLLEIWNFMHSLLLELISRWLVDIEIELAIMILNRG